MSPAQDEPPRRTGRPIKPADERKSEMLRFRVRADLKRRLEAEALSFGRSVSEEAEKRLENSFKLEDLHRLIFGKGPAGDFLRNIVSGLMAIHDYEISPGQRIGSPDWASSDATRAAIRAMLEVLVDEYIPLPRTTAEVAAVGPTPWTPAREEYYNQTVNYMQAMGTDMALMMIGKGDDIVATPGGDGVKEQ